MRPLSTLQQLLAMALLVCTSCKGGDKAEATEPASSQPATQGATSAPTGKIVEPPSQVPTAGTKNKAPEGPTGSIKGRVTLTGDVPEMPFLSRGSDPACDNGELRSETIMRDAEGGLANVLVRIKPGTVAAWTPSETIVIDQTDCMYRPRVQGGVRGQTVEVRNSDKTTHNVHARHLELGAREGSETLMNRAQPSGVKMRFRLGIEPVAKLKCDYHAWMSGFVVVSDNPYSAVSDSKGEFMLEGVPVGTHQVELWHEFLGLKSAELVVEEDGTAVLEHSYDFAADNPRKKASK
jgi:plastocyanin